MFAVSSYFTISRSSINIPTKQKSYLNVLSYYIDTHFLFYFSTLPVSQSKVGANYLLTYKTNYGQDNRNFQNCTKNASRYGSVRDELLSWVCQAHSTMIVRTSKQSFFFSYLFSILHSAREGNIVREGHKLHDISVHREGALPEVASLDYTIFRNEDSLHRLLCWTRKGFYLNCLLEG